VNPARNDSLDAHIRAGMPVHRSICAAESIVGVYSPVIQRQRLTRDAPMSAANADSDISAARSQSSRARPAGQRLRPMVLHICSGSDGCCQAVAVRGIAPDDLRDQAAGVTRDWTGTTLGERVRFMADNEGVSLNKLGERAGLKSGAMSRLSRDSGEVHRSPETLAKLADAWGYSVEWLTYGRGQPRAAVARDERYPHRAQAARIALDGGIDPVAVNEVLAEQIELDRDPSILWWLHHIESRALRLRDHHTSATNDTRHTRSKK
jgi:transcriptional regulator with XRE-family HTH domain